MKDVLIIAVLAVIIGLVVWYLIRAKKKGVKCIGCPDGATCGKSGCAGCSGCNGSCGADQLSDISPNG